MKQLKILFGYSYFPSSVYIDIKKMNEDYINKLRENNFDVTGFCLTVNPPTYHFDFKELDKKWKRGDKDLLSMYEKLENALCGVDVFINSVGINLHPKFVEKLPVFTVFQCMDDPENSDNLSKPVANSYDLCLVGNIAEVETYKSWGVENVEWTPMGVMPEIYDNKLTYNDIIIGKRDIDLFMMIDRAMSYRKTKLDKISNAFPNGDFYGKGWPKGFLPSNKQIEYLKRSKIGINIHNSTGPINYRTYYLPANGVMQVCDNKSHLGKIYELGKEVVGFDTIDECIELCNYYLKHDDERRQIAANGWKRCIEDYTEIAIFKRNVALFESYIKIKKNRLSFSYVSKTQYKRTLIVRIFYRIISLIDFIDKFIKFLTNQISSYKLILK